MFIFIMSKERKQMYYEQKRLITKAQAWINSSLSYSVMNLDMFQICHDLMGCVLKLLIAANTELC